MLERVITRRRGQQRPSDPNEARRGAVKACAADTRIEEEVLRRTEELQTALDIQHRRLHEMGHRVKNDLQTLSALTILKARRTEDESARHALFGMAGRIGALSTAYRLVDSTNDERVDASALIKEIAADLVATSEGQPTAVALELEPVAVSAEAAAPLALLVNELIGNALRHAGPNGREGRLVIPAHREGDAARLVIAVDGCRGRDAAPSSDAFGRRLSEMLARQIKAELVWEDADPGTRAVVLLREI